MWAETECGVQRASAACGSTVKPDSSTVTSTTPLIGRVEHSAPHSATFAPCHAAPGCSPFMSGSAAMPAVSVARPAITMSAPVASASLICSVPASATMLWHDSMSRRSISGASGSATRRPASNAPATLSGGWEDLTVATLTRWPISVATSSVIPIIQSTIASVPQVPADPMIRGTPASVRASIRSRHSAFVEACEYFDSPEPR